MHRDVQPVEVFYQNVRGLRTKTNNFFVSVLETLYPVIVLTETWLNESIYNGELFDDNYVVYRRDRNSLACGKSRGGGVLIAVLKSLCSCELVVLSDREELWVQIKNNKFHITLCAVYIPPHSGVNVYSEHLAEVDNVISRWQNSSVCVIGDFNLPGIKWVPDAGEVGFRSTDFSGECETSFCDFVDYLGLSQLNGIVNVNNVILDLVLTNNNRVTVIQSIPLVALDINHPSLLITFNESDFTPISEQSYVSYNFSAAPYVIINDALGSIEWSFLDNMSIDDGVSAMYDILNVIISQYVPVKTFKSGSFPPWIDKQTQELIFDKKLAHKNYKITKSSESYDAFKSLRSRVRSSILRSKANYIKQSEENIIINPNHFWKYIKSMKKELNIPNRMKFDGTEFEGVDSICAGFASFFSGFYCRRDDAIVINCCIGDYTRENLSSVKFSVDLVTKAISKLKKDSCCGLDGIPSTFVINSSAILSVPLSIIFNKCINEGYFPEIWKHSYAVPIFKAGIRSDISNYRPICINSNFPKIFDSIISQIITDHVKNYIIEEQHGFVSGRSTETNLFIFTEYITKNMENGFPVECIYTDLAKAFDRVSIELLLYKLKALYGIHDPLLSCLSHYLKNRSQYVKMGNSVSDSLAVTSGVGQGTHSGPVLFSLFVNDVKLVFKHCEFLLFADDCKIYSAIKESGDRYKVQCDLNNFVNWCKENGLNVNIKKCKRMLFSRQINPFVNFNYYIDGNIIENVTVMKDLGVTLDAKLSYVAHIDNIVSKSNRMLGFVKRSTEQFTNLRTINLLFVSLIRPILEYCSVIWSPSYDCHIARIEGVQRKFIKYMCYKAGINYHSNNYPFLNNYFSLPELQKRREFFDVVFVFKVLNYLIKCSQILGHFSLNAPTHLLRSNNLLNEAYHRTNYGQTSSLNRMVVSTNRIENCDIFCDSLFSFKNRLRSRT